MRSRRWRKGMLLVSIVCLPCILGIAALWLLLRPPFMDRTEIFKGIFLSVEPIASREEGQGQVMIVEVHWDEPGVSLRNRTFSENFTPGDPSSPHYRATMADWALVREGAAVLMNTTLFQPNGAIPALPGVPLRSVETLVVNGEVSHIHDHTYLLYWDHAMEAKILRQKPPTAEALSEASLGIGLQGIQVADGRPAYNAIAHKDEIFTRCFIGMDPGQKILWLMVFEKATAYDMIDRAIAEGVRFGGQVDSGTSANLLIGWGATGLWPHTGIRHPKPIGPYLVVESVPL